MSTNYYLRLNSPADTPQELHLGLRLNSRRFLFHAHPDQGIHSVEDWERRFSEGVIMSEYDVPMTPSEFRAMVDAQQAGATRLQWWEQSDASPRPGANRYLDAQGYSFDARDFC